MEGCRLVVAYNKWDKQSAKRRQASGLLFVMQLSSSIHVDGSLRKMGRMKRTWMEVVRIDLKMCNLPEDLAHDRLEW